MAKMNEITSTTWKKLVEIETTDFSVQGIYNAIIKECGEEFFPLEEIEDTIKSGFIEICEDGFIIWMD